MSGTTGSDLGAGFEHVRLRLAGHVGWLEFNRAPINAFHQAMVEEVLAALEALAAEPEVRVVVLASG